MRVSAAYWLQYAVLLLLQNSGYFPESVISLLTATGSGFDVNNTHQMNIKQLAEHVSNCMNCLVWQWTPCFMQLVLHIHLWCNSWITHNIIYWLQIYQELIFSATYLYTFVLYFNNCICVPPMYVIVIKKMCSGAVVFLDNFIDWISTFCHWFA